MQSVGNPFIGLSEVTSLVKKEVSKNSNDVYKLEKLGVTLFKDFIADVFVDKTRSLFDPIKQNNIGFFKKEKPKDKTAKLSKVSLDIVVTNIFFSAQQRNLNKVKELLRYEIEIPPPSLTIPKCDLLQSQNWSIPLFR